MDIKLQIIEELHSFLRKAMDNKSRYCQRKQDFTRNRILSFERVACFVLNLPKRSLAVELEGFAQLFGVDLTPTKGAFSQARYKLKPDLFMDWNTALIKAIERYGLLGRHWNGFRLIGIDGTLLQLPETDEIGEAFSYKANQHGGYPMAQVLCAHDVLNGFCHLADIRPVTASEPGMALEMVKSLPRDSLSIYDRGFPSSGLIHLLEHEKRNYLIRAKLGFNHQVRAFVKSGESSRIVGFPLTGKARERLSGFVSLQELPSEVNVRLVRVVLDNGETEVLITSLTDQNAYPDTLFKELYFYRWGVEVFFDLFKNILQVEIFTGHKPLAILQEFHAMVLVANLHQLVVQGAATSLEVANQSRKYCHKINQNVTLGLFKNAIVKLLLGQQPERVWDGLVAKFLKHTVPIIKGRSNPRKKEPKRIRGKYKTLTNYRRAV